MQQAKYAAPLPAVPGYEMCCWRAAWAGRCSFQVWGRTGHPFIFGPWVETKGQVFGSFLRPRFGQEGNSPAVFTLGR